MNVTKKAITERLKLTDVVIELLDARLPGSSSNPLLAELTGSKPKLKILNKQDLADPERTQLWLDHFNAQASTQALGLDASETAPAQRLAKACRELVPNRGGMAKPVRVLICGIPNVGKSTLLNTLVGKRSAKTGDEAGVTRIEQRINLAPDMYLFDTPGMLWPKIIVDKGGYHLAASGAVGRNAYDDEEVALELLESLKTAYPQLLSARYRLDETDVANTHEDELLTRIGQRRGAVRSGARVDLVKAAEIVLQDFRSAVMGRITLETPDQFQAWLLQAQVIEAERQEKKAARTGKGKTSKGSKGPKQPD